MVPSPPATLTNSGAADNHEELELLHLEQDEETTARLQGSSPKKQKTGKKKSPEPSSTRLRRRRRSQTKKMMIHLNLILKVNLQLHPISTRTIKPICRCNPIMRKNSLLTIQLHPALGFHREPCSTLTKKTENLKTLRGQEHMMIWKPTMTAEPKICANF